MCVENGRFMGRLRLRRDEDGGLRIRAAEPADVEPVMALMRETAEAPAWKREVFEGYVGGGEGVARDKGMMVAEREGRTVGFVAGSVVCGIAELECIVVEQAERGRGIGRKMLEALATWAKGRGAESMELEVRASNENAMKLYAALGFAETARRRGYYREPVEDAVLMTWHL